MTSSLVLLRMPLMKIKQSVTENTKGLRKYLILKLLPKHVQELELKEHYFDLSSVDMSTHSVWGGYDESLEGEL